ncbi:hypothetical protein SCB71_15875 [Herbiconiux sp. KACC 21604]|uniref:hypothetical protein n=1 Tax=unclassified Herbiconiux TaxID=2618217 RepID=UPI001492AD30|nr:hypothetical protein [Herbiconiux sp. SALV-R1]QJU54598.1 hypothetical protein HL652_13825 [Herbiconiux sp. SALV-R1]WPO85684.1 hypothetical protein SCB71_15875 [Herbiconiux sp. KACC 21604]
MTDDAHIPRLGATAARVLLDAVISQSSGQSMEANISAMAVALEALTQGAGGDGSGAEQPEASDVVGAAVVCISWLAAHLAAEKEVDLEDVVADLRGFIEDVSER